MKEIKPKIKKCSHHFHLAECKEENRNKSVYGDSDFKKRIILFCSKCGVIIDKYL